MEVPIQAKRQVAEQKLLMWQNTHYSAELDAKIAQAIDDAPMLEQAKANMKRALQVMGQLEEILAELIDKGGEQA